MEEREALRTKIICTLGPSSHDMEVLRRMVEAGMDMARINSGHCDVREVPGYVELVRSAALAVGRRVGVLLDLQGPRLRVGPVQGSGIELKAGQEFTITTRKKRGDASGISIDYQGLASDLKPGDFVLADDGLIRMTVKRIDGEDVLCEVLEGGMLIQGKGINFPGADLRMAAFTERDRRYMEAGLEAGIDWVAQSFVRRGADVGDLVSAMDEAGGRVPVMAKIEKPEAVNEIEQIIDVADGIMVARGDLGVEMDPADVPQVQKELIKKAATRALPVVTATQMLQSMVMGPRPSRAEASDVHNAILDGTDALMLSAETAIGLFPVESVLMMARIAEKAERTIDYDRILGERGGWKHRGTADAIGFAACKVAADLKAKAIITMTRSGHTARLVARYRPDTEILAVSPDERVLNALTVAWGVRGLAVLDTGDLRRMISDSTAACAEAGYVDRGDLVVITGGFLDEESSSTNVVHVRTVE